MGVLPKEEKMLIPAVILSAHLMGYGIIRALGRMNVPLTAVYYQKKDMGYVSKYVDRRVLCPHPEYDEEGFCQCLQELGKETGKSVLFPADDATLAAVSKKFNILKKFFIPGFCNRDVAHKFLVKKYTYKIAEETGVEYPRTYYSADTDHFQNLDLKFPVLVKPCQSHEYVSAFNKKMTVVNNYTHLKEACRISEGQNIEVMIQEIVTGGESNGINYNSLMINGEIVSGFTAEKIRYTPSCYGVPCSTVSIDPIPGIKEASEKVLRAMGFEGYSCIEYKKDDRDGRYKLLEINGRFNRSIMHTVGAGINFPWLYYSYLTTGKLPEFTNEYKKKFYWIDESHDPIICAKNCSKFSFGKIIGPYFGKKVFAILELGDPKPFIKRIADAMKCVFKNIYKAKQPKLIKQ